MVRFERKETEKAKKAIMSLEYEKGKNGTYNTEEVMTALKEMFHSKCYLCEGKEIMSYQIEHLVPHKNNNQLKYDWNNLFLSCTHCNNIKGDKHNPILDCSREDVDKKIAFRKTGYFGTDEKFEFEAVDKGEATYNTIRLLEEIYYGGTPQKRMEAAMIRQALRKEISAFKEYVREYNGAEGEEKEDLLCMIKRELSNKSAYTSFKRWLIRDNGKYFPELLELLNTI